MWSKKEIGNQYKQRMPRVGTRNIQSKAFEVGGCKKGSRNLMAGWKRNST